MNKENPQYRIDPDIASAHTLPGEFYENELVFAKMREEIFPASWQLVADESVVKIPGQVYPFDFVENFVEEPLLLTRDFNDELHCVSNVCTHRGTLVAEHAGSMKHLRCRYHGRRFELDGTFRSMPECEDLCNFPSPSDDLPKVEFARFHQFLFASLSPAFSFEQLVSEMERRVSFLPIEEAKLDSTRSREYLVNAHWALYCDNYLEGFHIPYVHPGLNEEIDYSGYRTELFPFSNVQVGIAKGGDGFDLPKSSPDYGQNIAAYYFWLFPNLMFNFYPWGISVNIVKPVHPKKTRVSFLAYVWDESKLEDGAGAELDKVEREDEEIVESVQRGVSSRLYKRGRFSAKREQGVHHFHSLLAQFVSRETLHELNE